MKHIGKMLILTFEDHEENMIDWIVSCLGIGVKSNKIDQAIYEAEQEVTEGAEPISLESAMEQLNKKYYG